MADLAPLYVIGPIVFLSLFVAVFVYLFIKMCARYKRYGFIRLPPFELYEFSSVDIESRIATYTATKEAQEWARKFGKYFSPYQVRVRAKRIHLKEDNTPYLIGVWLTYEWNAWSWGVSISAHSI